VSRNQLENGAIRFILFYLAFKKIPIPALPTSGRRLLKYYRTEHCIAATDAINSVLGPKNEQEVE
jgi:hypothetical protein